MKSLPLFLFQRIRSTVDEKEQKQLLMDLDVVMRSSDCPYIVQFYGALFREVGTPNLLHLQQSLGFTLFFPFVISNSCWGGESWFMLGFLVLHFYSVIFSQETQVSGHCWASIWSLCNRSFGDECWNLTAASPSSCSSSAGLDYPYSCNFCIVETAAV